MNKISSILSRKIKGVDKLESVLINSINPWGNDTMPVRRPQVFLKIINSLVNSLNACKQFNKQLLSSRTLVESINDTYGINCIENQKVFLYVGERA